MSMSAAPGVPHSEHAATGRSTERAAWEWEPAELPRRRRVLVIATHPIQYAAPLFRLLGRDPRLDLLTVYCSLQGAEPGIDPGFGVEVAWDVPLLDGYRWLQAENRSPVPGIGRFVGLLNPALWGLVRRGRFDAVVLPGYAYASLWIALAAAKLAGRAVLMATDAVTVETTRGGWWWKRWVKGSVVRMIYRFADVLLVPSTATREFLRSLGVPDEHMVPAHYTVDNEAYARAAAGADRSEVRRRWNVPEDALVVLVAAKLVPWKAPLDPLRALGKLRDAAPGRGVYLVFAGDGELRGRLEEEARALAVEHRVRFLGFVNQSRMPEVYVASDLLVLPSRHEPWGLVVNEAMACGVPVIVSDRVGAGRDLVEPGETGEVYPAGDVEALAATMQGLLEDPSRRARFGEAGARRICGWSYREHIEGFVAGVEMAIAHRRPRVASRP